MEKGVVKATVSIILMGSLLFEVSATSAYSQAGDLEARKARYGQLRIDIGDGRHATMREGAVAETILNSPFASDETKRIAQRYRDDLLINRIWNTASWAVPVLTFLILGAVGQPLDEATKSSLSTVSLSIGVLGVASFVVSRALAPHLPPVAVDSYNEDLRMKLNLSEADVLKP